MDNQKMNKPKMKKQKMTNREKPQAVTPQQMLFALLKPRQQELVAEVFGSLKKKKQAVLAVALLDFIEMGLRIPPNDVVTGGAFLYLTNEERGPGAVRTLGAEAMYKGFI